MNRIKKDSFEIENVRGHFVVKYKGEQISVEDSYQEAEQFISDYKDSLTDFIIYYEYLTKDDRWILAHSSVTAVSDKEAEMKFKSKIGRKTIRGVDVRLAS